MGINKIYKNRRGIALVEVIAALGISVVVITSLVSLSLYSLRSSLQSKLQLQGTQLAKREMELLRAYRERSDSSWQIFINSIRGCYGNSPCCINTQTLTVQSGTCSEGTGAEVINRYFTISKISGGQAEETDDMVRATVTASWTIGGEPKNTYLYTDFTNWNLGN